jgi:hypothetical protein
LHISAKQVYPLHAFIRWLSFHATRFHTETLDTASKEVDMKGVGISIGNIDLIVDSHLRLKAGVRYGFLGRFALSPMSKVDVFQT